MKLLVTGASGLLGSAVFRIAQARGIEVFGTFMSSQIGKNDLVKLDITDKNQTEKVLLDLKLDTVIHTAASTNMDWCEQNKEAAYRVNAEGTLNIAETCRKTGAFLVYVSTDYVFDGKRGPYREGDIATPVLYYGLTKLKGEEFVGSTLENFCIARTAMQFGWGGSKENFALYVINRLQKNQSVQAITDLLVTPSYNANVADMLLEIAERNLKGVIHTAGATRTTRYDFALKVAEIFGLNKDLITGTTSEELQWKTPRPKNGGLDVSRAMQTLQNKPLRLDDALRRMLEDKKNLKRL